MSDTFHALFLNVMTQPTGQSINVPILQERKHAEILSDTGDNKILFFLIIFNVLVYNLSNDF